ncbi:MAG TPA: putative toxin-antitoxin system toxin component, PIN family [Firmicutes bacterium]|nr:putative toxin-antitoxin system toxin component, PIN family [Bacillota bacterium]
MKRKPKEDDFLLECAVEGDADYIITGDQDLLCLTPFEGIQILEPSEFLTRWPKIRVSLHS